MTLSKSLTKPGEVTEGDTQGIERNAELSISCPVRVVESPRQAVLLR